MENNETNTPQVIDFQAAKEGRLKQKEVEDMNTNNIEPKNKQEPSEFEVTVEDGTKYKATGYLGLYPEFVVIGDGEGSVKAAYNGWKAIHNLTETVVTESDA